MGSHRENVVAGGRYVVGAKVGSGSFGDIFAGLDRQNGEKVAIKVESSSARNPKLFHEAKCYAALAGHPGIPAVHWSGVADLAVGDLPRGEYNILVMDLLGPSLEELFTNCDRKFSVETVLQCADQMIALLELCHSKGILHRDIKPHNFLMGLGNESTRIYLIDFGLSKSYRDPKTDKHVAYREGRSLTGTRRYVSLNVHHGIEQSRRDDLESLGYVLMHFLRGTLPWQGMKGATKKEKLERIKASKLSTEVEDLCFGFPPEFGAYLHACRNLRFDEKPDYAALRRLLR
jgi:casein kinase 1